MSKSTAGPQSNGWRRILATLTALLLAVGWPLLLPTAASADGPTTFTNTTSIAIPATGSANQTGPASPYPSAIAVAGMSGPVTDVTVTFANLTHSIAGDIDALLVAPTGANLMVLSDVADPQNTFATAVNTTLTFSDAAAGPVPVARPIPSGRYLPTNNGTTDPMPAPAPAPSSNTTLAGAFNGINPNGSWQLFINDDNTGDLGTMAGGWSLTITTEAAAVATTTTVATSGSPSTTGESVEFTATVTAGASPVTTGSVQFSADGTSLGAAVPLNASGNAVRSTSALAEGTHLIRATYSGAPGLVTSNATVSQRVDNATVVTGNTFCNTGVITVPSQGTATPYPSNISVSGLAGQVTKVTAELKGLSHQVPGDLDILLSGPTPATNLFLLSDAGGQSPASNVTLDFDDAAPSTVPSPLVSGTFQPTQVDDQSNDAMPAPAPTPSSATELSTFDGSSPNGTWSLWVVDDASGDSGSISGGWCLTITSTVPTTTVLTSSLNPSTVGDPVTLTATVTSAGSPVAAGSVQFSDGGVPIGGPVPVAADGTATLDTSALAVGTHPIQALYAGATGLAPSTGALDQVVNLLTTTTTLTSDLNPSGAGQTIVLTATVASGGAPVSSGTVQFSDAGTALGVPVALAPDGTSTLTTSALTVGSHALSAQFAASGNYDGSTGVLTQVVDLAPTATTVTSGTSPSVFGAPVTFTATVTRAGAPVTVGSVQFADGATPLGAAVPVAGDGTAAVTTSALSAGAHTISATFSGTAELALSTGSVDQVVGQAASSTMLAGSPNPSTFGQSVTFTATVASGGSPVGAGTVQFSAGSTALCASVPVDGTGTATCDTMALPGGTQTITATFSGTADVTGSSGQVEQVVNPAGTTTILTGSSPSAFGDPTTFTATVSSGADPIGSGVVEFSVDGGAAIATVDLAADGTAVFTTASLVAGGHTISARYSGTPSYAASVATIAHEVTLAADANGPYTVAEGASLTLDGSGSSPGADYGWDVNNDGDFTDAVGESPTLTWAQLEALGIDDGPSSHAVTLQVSSGVVTALNSATLAVTNTAPTAVVTGDLTATVDVPFTVKVGADDPSSADMAGQFTYTIDWGDGSPVEIVVGPADPPVTHTYLSAGDYDAAFTAADQDGGQGDPTSVTVGVAPAATTSPSPSPTATSSPSPSASPTTSPSASPSTSPTASPTGTSSPGPTTTPTQAPDDGALAATGAGQSPALLSLALLLIAAGCVMVAVRRSRGASS